MNNPPVGYRSSDLSVSSSPRLSGQPVESRTLAMARTEKVEILELLRANQAEILNAWQSKSGHHNGPYRLP
jgi:hypothetical protein